MTRSSMRQFIGLSIIIIFIILSIIGCNTLKAIAWVNGGTAEFQNGESKVPFTRKGHTIFIKARINDSHKMYNFIFDTSALTAVSRRLANELNLKDGVEVASGDTGGKSKAVTLVKLNSINISDAKVLDCAAGILDFLDQIDAHIDGIIGSNVLKYFKITIDYKGSIITFSDDTQKTTADNDAVRIPFKLDMKSGFAPKIKCKINDEIEADGIIDTGSPAIADLPLSIMTQLKSFHDGAVLTSKGSMSGGAFGMSAKSYLLRIDKLQIEDLGLSNIPSISHSGKANNILIGAKFLSRFLVTLNYPAGEMILRPYGTNFDTNIYSYGLALNKSGNKTIVTGVWNDSPADKEGIKPGDEIITVNTKKSDELSLIDLMSILRDENNNDIEIQYINERGKSTVTLRKAALLPPLK